MIFQKGKVTKYKRARLLFRFCLFGSNIIVLVFKVRLLAMAYGISWEVVGLRALKPWRANIGLHQWLRSKIDPQLLYKYFYNHAHAHRLRLEKLVYRELSRTSPNGFFF
jgi:hypothetical protein